MDQCAASLEAVGAALGSATRPQTLSLWTLPGDDLASAAMARRHVAGTARSWGLPKETTEALETVIGELAANALEHTASRSVAVTLALAGRSVVVTVTDEGAGDISVTALPEGDDEHGRGLFMVAALAHRWGGRRSRQGLTVWAEVITETGTRLPREGAVPAPGSPWTGTAECHGPTMASPMTKPLAGPSGMTASVP
ncbi:MULTISPECIES: ATP-binding protein [Streptomyces violaceusniger group]|uniref:ATP-binding protein n=1 Tax=Streptomyces violaceusniger group TaxID=2839105 RepID=UPI00142D7F59|nr:MULTISPECIES: ATP-binding protein [Streptomyces violaceusniger group]